MLNIPLFSLFSNSRQLTDINMACGSMLGNNAWVAMNIIGLALGPGCCILIPVFVEDELGFALNKQQ